MSGNYPNLNDLNFLNGLNVLNTGEIYCAKMAPIHFRPAMTKSKLKVINTTNIAAEELKWPPIKDS